MGNKQSKKTTSTELTQDQIGVLKSNSKFTERQIREWHESFMRDCPTGRIDKKRFVEFYKQFYPNGKVDNYCKHAFRPFDTDNNGTIDFQEFLLAIATKTQGDLNQRLTFAFNMYDMSKDGLINQKGLITLITAIYDLLGETDRTGDRDPKNIATNIIEKLDTNDDNKLSKIEFIAGCKNNPNICRLLAPNI